MEKRVQLVVYAITVVAAAALVAVFVIFPPEITPRWITAALTLLGLALFSTALPVTITEGGSTTSMAFVPKLAAVVLLGPAGAGAVTAATHLAARLFSEQKPLRKTLYNVSQAILTILAAGLAYQWFGGVPTVIPPLDFRATFPPFLAATVAFFAVNTSLVAFILAFSEGKSFFEVWRQISGGLILFDLAMGPLGYLVAFLFVKWGVVALLLTIIPLIGLRYSYGANYELQKLNADLLRLMIKTIEAQDPYTSGHSIRVAERAKAIAQALGLRHSWVRNIETAALLHDIGKIDIAYGEILRQKGPLTPEQRQLIRDHPDKGVDIIRSIRSIHPSVLAYVKHHHERYDGDGYPVGLAAEEIPIGARIIMICDTIDAMLTARPYRDALPIHVVREELLRHRGAQFDPSIVDIVLSQGILEDASFSLEQPLRLTPRTASLTS